MRKPLEIQLGRKSELILWVFDGFFPIGSISLYIESVSHKIDFSAVRAGYYVSWLGIITQGWTSPSSFNKIVFFFALSPHLLAASISVFSPNWRR
jgi:hypothetical protein